jgi:hypothetical protein
MQARWRQAARRQASAEVSLGVGDVVETWPRNPELGGSFYRLLIIDRRCGPASKYIPFLANVPERVTTGTHRHTTGERDARSIHLRVRQ